MKIKYEQRFKHCIEFIATFRNYLSFIFRQMYNKISVHYIYTTHKYLNCVKMKRPERFNTELQLAYCMYISTLSLLGLLILMTPLFSIMTLNLARDKHFCPIQIFVCRIYIECSLILLYICLKIKLS